MAKPAWITLSKTSGDGNGSIAVSATPHTGRTTRTGSIAIQNQSGTKPSKTVNLSQVGTPAKMTLVTTTPPVIPGGGGEALIQITGNAIKFRVALGLNYEFIESVSYKINGGQAQPISSEDGFIIIPAGDPGATAQYEVVFIAKILANNTPVQKSIPFEIAPESGETWASILSSITLQAGASTLLVNPESLSLVAAGTAQNVAVTSNDNWLVS